jgi:hypothetical protein
VPGQHFYGSLTPLFEFRHKAADLCALCLIHASLQAIDGLGEGHSKALIGDPGMRPSGMVSFDVAIFGYVVHAPGR